jgi:hypothetical protein
MYNKSGGVYNNKPHQVSSVIINPSSHYKPILPAANKHSSVINSLTGSYLTPNPLLAFMQQGAAAANFNENNDDPVPAECPSPSAQRPQPHFPPPPIPPPNALSFPPPAVPSKALVASFTANNISCNEPPSVIKPPPLVKPNLTINTANSPSSHHSQSSRDSSPSPHVSVPTKPNNLLAYSSSQSFSVNPCSSPSSLKQQNKSAKPAAGGLLGTVNTSLSILLRCSSLKKFGCNSLVNLNQRYFKLYKDKLIYYKSELSSSSQGNINLLGSQLESASDEYSNQFRPNYPANCCFSITAAGRKYIFVTESSNDRSLWLQCLAHSTDNEKRNNLTQGSDNSIVLLTDSRLELEGFLYKQGGSNKGFKKRYCIYNRSIHSLSYYKEQPKSKGEISLKLAESKPFDASKLLLHTKSADLHISHDLIFTIQTHTSNKDLYVLVANSQPEKQQWLAAIDSCIRPTNNKSYNAASPNNASVSSSLSSFDDNSSVDDSNDVSDEEGLSEGEERKNLSALELLQRGVEEFFATEESYVNSLKLLINVYIARFRAMNKLNHAVLLSEAELAQIFSNLEAIYDLNHRFLQDLTALRMKGSSQLLFSIGNTFRQYIPFFKIYTIYVKSYDAAQLLLNQLIPKRIALKQFLDVQMLCENNKNLELFLIQPVQRVPRYVLLLEMLAKHGEQVVTDTSNVDNNLLNLNEIQSALTEIRALAHDINSCVTLWDAKARVVAVQAKFSSQLNLVIPGRHLIKEGHLKKMFSRKNLHIKSYHKYAFFLFNDMLMYAGRPTGIGEYSYKYSMPLITMEIHDFPDSNQIKNAFQLYSQMRKDNEKCTSPTNKSQQYRKVVIFAEDEDEKFRWMKEITNAIAKLKQNLNSFQI